MGLMRIISERTIDVKEEMSLYFIDWQKDFNDPYLYMGQKRNRQWVIGRGVRQGCCMSPILFNLYGEYLMKEVLAEVGDFRIGGRIINKVRFADDTAIIAKTQEELQDMVNRLVDTERKYGMEINIDKSQVMRVTGRGRSGFY